MLKTHHLLQFKQMHGVRDYVSVIEVDVMLKAQEFRLRNELEQMDIHNEKHVKAQSSNFNDVLKELKYVTRERHVLFVKDVKTIRVNVNLKIEELRVDMAKEVAALNHNYSSLHS